MSVRIALSDKKGKRSLVEKMLVSPKSCEGLCHGEVASLIVLNTSSLPAYDPRMCDPLQFANTFGVTRSFASALTQGVALG